MTPTEAQAEKLLAMLEASEYAASDHAIAMTFLEDAYERGRAETWMQARIKLHRDCIHEHVMRPIKTRMIDCDRCILLCYEQAIRAHAEQEE